MAKSPAEKSVERFLDRMDQARLEEDRRLYDLNQDGPVTRTQKTLEHGEESLNISWEDAELYLGEDIE